MSPRKVGDVGRRIFVGPFSNDGRAETDGSSASDGPNYPGLARYRALTAVTLSKAPSLRELSDAFRRLSSAFETAATQVDSNDAGGLQTVFSRAATDSTFFADALKSGSTTQKEIPMVVKVMEFLLADDEVSNMRGLFVLKGFYEAHHRDGSSKEPPRRSGGQANRTALRARASRIIRRSALRAFRPLRMATRFRVG